MSKIWDEREKSLENEYFRRKEQELVEKLRAKRAQEKEREKVETSAIHCPKCDGMLVEVTFEDVQIDRSPSRAANSRQLHESGVARLPQRCRPGIRKPATRKPPTRIDINNLRTSLISCPS